MLSLGNTGPLTLLCCLSCQSAVGDGERAVFHARSCSFGTAEAVSEVGCSHQTPAAGAAPVTFPQRSSPALLGRQLDVYGSVAAHGCLCLTSGRTTLGRVESMGGQHRAALVQLCLDTWTGFHEDHWDMCWQGLPPRGEYLGTCWYLAGTMRAIALEHTKCSSQQPQVPRLTWIYCLVQS